MKPRQRQARIAALVDSEGEMSVDALASRFDVSAETIRRDLGQLAENGTILKIHGGARRPRLLAEGSFQERMAEDAGAKQLVGRKLAELIEPGDTIFIDTGSTTLACAQQLASKPALTVITNSTRIAQIMGTGEGKATVYLIGGQYSPDNSQTVGAMAIAQIGQFQADCAVITVAAIDAEVGAMDASLDEAHVARAMINCARQLIVVAHAGKFLRRAAFRVCRLNEIDILVTDRLPEPAFAAALGRADVQIH